MENIKEIIDGQRKYFNSGKTKEILPRINNLRKLKETIKKNEKSIMEALKIDLNKSEFEAYLSEIGFVYEEINQATKNLNNWATPESIRTPLTHIGSTSHVYYEPFGLALIISPWNYPFHLAITPLISAIAAGNCAIIKPSEITPNVSKAVKKIIEEAFPIDFVAVVEGAVETSTALLDEKFDYIFFTGSTNVGRIVMEKAAKYLTPVTLELGGKSPCIIHHDAKLKLAAKRIIWGKLLNAGQSCIAPDYLYVHQDIKDEFISYLKQYIEELYGENIFQNEDYPKIINKGHFDRLKNLLTDGRVLYGGTFDEDRLIIEPTILDQIDWSLPVMQGEIFGPIIPIIEYSEIEEVVTAIKDHPKPLALYLFTSDKELQNDIIMNISFGSGCINDTIFHIGNPHLPFGGVGDSGMGYYHGRNGFVTFSHRKSILKQTTLFDIPLRYSTTKNVLNLVKKLLK